MTFFRNNILLRKKSFKNNYSMLFDGVNEYLNINNVNTALATTTKGTWSCWIKVSDATPANFGMFISFGGGNATDLIQIYIYQTTGVLSCSALNNGVTQWDTDTDTAAFSNNVWSHCGLVQDGVSPVLYVNGIAPAQAFVSSTNKTVWFNDLIFNNGRIGARFYSVTEGDGALPLNGNIDEVGFFNTNLTAAQMNEIYNNGKPKNLLKHSANANLVSYYRMGDNDTFDGTNWTLIDKKGTNNGTSVNMEFSDVELDTV